MPKLIIKQETGTVTRKMRYATWLSVSGLLLLLITVATAAVLFTKSPVKSSELVPLSLSSAPESDAKSDYELLHATLGALGAEYESVTGHDVDDYQKNLKLLGKSESILSHLNKMDAAAHDLGLNNDELKELLDRHQFYMDYWEAKLHFRELRVSRFESEAEIEDIPLEVTEVDKPKKKFQFAKPPEGMELPAGFCDLANPDSCKPELASEAEAVSEDLVLPDDLEAISNSNEAISDEVVAGKTKKKFQFAKPPEGMELPAGFCDLASPDSCKPEAENTSEVLNSESASKGSQAKLF